MASSPSRRAVLTAGSAALAAASVAPRALGIGFHPGGRGVLRVGLVGCGGRGTGAAVNALRADPQTELVALGDAFADQVESSLVALTETEGTADIAPRVKVDADHRFVGFDAYRGVIESSDVVLLATPPHFRPLHVRAAVEARKHLFVEKPVATDAPGVRSMLASAALAREQRLAFVSGLCYRYENSKRETVRRIHAGDIGAIRAVQTTYNTGGLWHRGRKPEWSDMEWQVRNWLYFTWLSGDHIVEQHIHSLDKVAWVMGEYPASCSASGGRSVRTEPEYGDVYDHFNTVYTWKSGVRAFSSCRQWVGAASDVSDHVFGSEGVAHLQTHQIEGPHAWRHRSEEPDDMYQNEHDALFASIRAGEPIHDGDVMCNSTLMAIMGRLSAYTGQTVTWEQALASELDLSPPEYAWGAREVAPVARPGVTKFV
jgi:predicted dehydrogenase